MQLRSASAAVATALLTLAAAAPAAMADREPLNAYRVADTAANKSTAGAGRLRHGRGRSRRLPRDLRHGQAGRRAQGRRARTRSSSARPTQVTSQAADVPVGSDAQYNVWRRYDRVPGDTKEQYLELYDRLEGMSIVKKIKIGTTHMGRDIIALKVTRTPRRAPTTRARPCSTTRCSTRASGWPARRAGARCCTSRRTTTRRPTTRPRQRSPSSSTRASCGSRASATRTATSTRSRPATACGARTWPTTTATACAARSSTASTRTATTPPTGAWTTRAPRTRRISETYRGTGPDSEPETKAIKSLWNHVDFKFQKNDHTAAELLLWPNGFQQYTPTPDDKLFKAYAGDDANSAIADKVFNAETEEWEITGNRFDPDIGAELYITNGDLTDDAYKRRASSPTRPRAPSRTSRTSRASSSRTSRPTSSRSSSATSCSRSTSRSSADDPANPISHMGNTVQNFYVETFKDSYGDPQAVEVVAKKSLGDVKLRYRINDGAVKTANTSKFMGGERFGEEPGLYFHRLRGTVTGLTLGMRSRSGSRAAASRPRTSPTRPARRPATRC